MQKQGGSISRDVSIAAAQYVKEKRYWLQKLSGELIKSYFPYDNDRTGDFLIPGEDSVTTCFAGERFSRLMQLSRGSDYSLHIIAVAVVLVLLAKYTNNDNKDIIVGAPIKKQAIASEIKFVNTVLALRVHLDGNMTLKELLVRVRETVLEADENKNYPIEVLMSMLNMPMAGDDTPLFDVAVLLENIHDIEYLRPVKVNMIFCLRKTAESVELDIRYNTARYERGTVERIAAQFDLVLQQMLSNVDLPLSDVDMTTGEEKKRLLEDFNNTAVEYPQDKTIHRLFAEQVERMPDRLAVVDSVTQHLTYKELNEKSDRLAYLLREKGVLADSIVGIMVERSMEMIIGIMGVLKAGGAYMPIAPDYPRERIDYMLKDSGAKLSVTTNDLEAPDFPLLPATGHWQPATSLAYVLYTSGTTGRPKGVMIEHRSVVNLVWGLWGRIYRRYNDDLKVALVSPYVFDASVKQIFAALLLGHTLCIVPEETRIDGAGLIEFYRVYGIDISDGTPTHLRMMRDAAGAGSREALFRGLNTGHFIIGGETMPRKIVEAFLKAFPNEGKGVIVSNVYGPTECCVDSTSFDISVETLSLCQRDIIPIGKPMPNGQIYILNPANRLQPIGLAGDLCVGGSGLARGYLNRPELTAEKFDQDLWDYRDYRDLKKNEKKHKQTLNQKFFGGSRGAILQKSPPGLLYKTGDLARWLPDGNIEFLGRMDSQVKIRGYRIELGEIETCLLKHPKVKEAVVSARVSETGNNFLCAYVTVTLTVFFDNPSSMPGEFKNYLSRLLPGYMIPAHFVVLEKIPLTPNGKVDRAALPGPVFQSSADYIMPRTPGEKTVARIWEDVLGVEDVGIDDNFFELGGNSLNIIQLGAELKEALQIDLPTVVLFRFTTIRTFLEYLRQRETGNRAAAREPEEKKDRAEAGERGKFMMKRAIDRRERRSLHEHGR
jgi:amino acid adenylation domain-containing protein